MEFKNIGAIHNYPPYMKSINPINIFQKVPSAIFINFPFCKKICAFCAFNLDFNIYTEEMEERYVKALIKNMHLLNESGAFESVDIKSIYFGGGTPNLLSDESLTSIIDTLNLYINLSAAEQVCMEATTVSINKKRVELLRSLGFNRISMGLQSTDDYYLKMLKVQGNYSDFLTAYNTCMDNGINNVNVDMMYRLPGQEVYHWEKSLSEVISLGVPHISVYSLLLNKENILYNQVRNGIYPEQQSEYEEVKYKEVTNELLSDSLYLHNTIDEFGLVGYENVYNKYSWTGETIGIGAGATSVSRNYVYDSVSAIDEYISMLDNSEIPIKHGLKMTPYNKMIRHMTLFPYYLNIDKTGFTSEFGYPISAFFEKELYGLIQEGFIKELENQYYLTLKGEAYAPYVSRCFLDVEQKEAHERMKFFFDYN